KPGDDYRRRVSLSLCEEQSGIRESNPFHSLGKAGHDRYTNPATFFSQQADFNFRVGAGKSSFVTRSSRERFMLFYSEVNHSPEMPPCNRTSRSRQSRFGFSRFLGKCRRFFSCTCRAVYRKTSRVITTSLWTNTDGMAGAI